MCCIHANDFILKLGRNRREFAPNTLLPGFLAGDLREKRSVSINRSRMGDATNNKCTVYVSILDPSIGEWLVQLHSKCGSSCVTRLKRNSWSTTTHHQTCSSGKVFTSGIGITVQKIKSVAKREKRSKGRKSCSSCLRTGRVPISITYRHQCCESLLPPKHVSSALPACNPCSVEYGGQTFRQ